MRRTRVLRVVAAALLAPAVGCTLGPDYQRPEVPTPEAWIRPSLEGETGANLPWWEVYHDPVLQDLVRTALAENKDLLTAVARIDEARAVLGFTKADQYPSFFASGGAARGKSSEEIPLGGDTANDFFVGASAFFEVDLWGKLRRSTEAARAELLATEEASRAVAIGLVADVASAYFRLRDLDERLEISRRTFQGRTDSLNLIRTRFQGGIVPELDVHQAEIEQAIAQAAVAVFERAVAQTEHALRVLLGRNPGEIPRGRGVNEDLMKVDIPAGLPSELLQRRPDVLVAERLLAAQTARIGVAEALKFPSLSLTGALGLESEDLDDLNNNAGFWNIAANAATPLFQFGKNEARVDVEVARTEQALRQYEKSVLVAFQEVEDALVAIRTFRDERDARSRQVDAGRGAVRLSRARYDAGFTAYLEVLDVERSLFEAELAEAESRQQELVAVAFLYRALGGGWPVAPEDPAAAGAGDAPPGDAQPGEGK